jgi:STE24 endopeptidase
MIYTIALETNQQVFPYKALVVGSFMVNLVLIFAKYAFEQYVNFRQLQRYTVKKLPSEVARLRINQEQFTRSQNYSFDKLAFEMYVLSLKIALDCLLILCNIMPLVWDSVINIFFFIDPNSEFQRGLCFLIIESLKAKTFEVPISLYQTFVIEKKYDYTNKTFQLFVYDLIVECALMLIILPPILYGYL